MRSNRSRHPAVLAGLVLALAAFAAAAQYPSKPVHIVAPSAPGDGSDLTARLISDRLSAAIGQPVIVENKLGAGGVVGTEYAAHQPPDGYTLIMANAGSHAINAALYGKLSYDPAKDPTLPHVKSGKRRALAQGEVRERLLAIGMEPMPGTPEEFAARQAADIAKWKRVVADSGAKVD